MNTDTNNAHSNLLTDMYKWHGLQFGWLHDNSHLTYTYVSSDIRSRSTIDHFVYSSEEIDKAIDNVYVQISAVNPSWGSYLERMWAAQRWNSGRSYEKNKKGVPLCSKIYMEK